MLVFSGRTDLRVSGSVIKLSRCRSADPSDSKNVFTDVVRFYALNVPYLS